MGVAGQAQSFSGAVIFNISGVVTFEHGSSFHSAGWIKLMAQGLRFDRAAVQSPSLNFYHDSCDEGIRATGLTVQASKQINIWCPLGNVNVTSSKLLVRSSSRSRGLSIYARNIYLEETFSLLHNNFLYSFPILFHFFFMISV